MPFAIKFQRFDAATFSVSVCFLYASFQGLQNGKLDLSNGSIHSSPLPSSSSRKVRYLLVVPAHLGVKFLFYMQHEQRMRSCHAVCCKPPLCLPLSFGLKSETCSQLVQVDDTQTTVEALGSTQGWANLGATRRSWGKPLVAHVVRLCGHQQHIRHHPGQ